MKCPKRSFTSFRNTPPLLFAPAGGDGTGYLPRSSEGYVSRNDDVRARKKSDRGRMSGGWVGGKLAR